MNRICYKILMCLVAVFVIGITGANAELQCVAQPSCSLLGYSTESIADCVSYIYCPFDKSYKNASLLIISAENAAATPSLHARPTLNANPAVHTKSPPAKPDTPKKAMPVYAPPPAKTA